MLKATNSVTILIVPDSVSKWKTETQYEFTHKYNIKAEFIVNPFFIYSCVVKNQILNKNDKCLADHPLQYRDTTKINVIKKQPPSKSLQKKTTKTIPVPKTTIPLSKETTEIGPPKKSIAAMLQTKAKEEKKAETQLK